MMRQFGTPIDRNARCRQPGVKGFLHWWLENPNNSKILILDIILNIVIIISVGFVFSEYAYEDNISNYILWGNDFFLMFFVVEYIVRFFIGSDFIWDITKKPGGSVFVAIQNKLRWMIRIQSIIDLIAILPILRYLRILRSLRLLRLLRLLRVLRILKIFRNAQKYLLVFRGLTETWRVFIFFFLFMGSVTAILALGIYLSEMTAKTDNFSTYQKTLWHTFQLIGVVEGTPSTVWGKIFSSMIVICNIFFFSIIVSLMTVKMGELMQNVKEGKLGRVKLKGHIVLCGFSRSARHVINDLLKEPQNRNNIVLITQRVDPDINGLIYVYGDFSEQEMLSKVNMSEANACVIFAETMEHDDRKMTDLRTIMTVFNIEHEYPHVHTICEINHSENADIIRSKIKGDEIIFKEIIDANVISTCLKLRNITPLVYELFNSEGKQLMSKNIFELGVGKGATFKELKELGLEQNFIALGVMRDGQRPVLAPDNDFTLFDDDKIILIG